MALVRTRREPACLFWRACCGAPYNSTLGSTMAKRTFASVTETPCTCGSLEQWVSHFVFPIRFNKQFNEYHFVSGSSDDDRVEIMIYHCPFCGGAAPESKRGTFFAEISEEEAKRLWALLNEINTAAQAFQHLGKPDMDEPYPTLAGRPKPTKEREGQKYEATRILTYSNLSPVAEVQFIVYGNDEVERTVAAKYTGAPSRGA